MVLERADDVLKDGLPVKFPLMTKPSGRAAGEGIFKFDDKRALHAYLTAPRADGANALPLLLQEFIPGEDFDFSGFCAGGRPVAWTIQRFLQFDGNVRWRQFTMQEGVRDVALRIVELTRYDGPINIDLRVDSRDGAVRAIEVNPRFWATTLAAVIDGVNYGDVGVRQAFDPAYSHQARFSGKVWGTPHRLPRMIFKHGGAGFWSALPRHTFFQVKYMLLDSVFSLVSSVRRRP
jgi:predicted ATP-grasp superfamily ATP-dependent carboligase